MTKKREHTERDGLRLNEGDVCSFATLGGGFGAFQVLRAKKKTIEVGILDAFTAEPPTVTELRKARVLRLGDGRPARYEPEEETSQPWWASRVGTLPPLERFTGPCDDHPLLDWLPELASAAWFDVHVARGSAPVERRDVRLGSSDDESILASVRSTENLRLLECFAPGVDIDLRDTHVRVLTLHVGERGRTRLRAPRWLRKLEVHGALEKLEVELPPGSFPFRIELHAEEIPNQPPQGLADVERLAVLDLRKADVRRLLPYRCVRHLKLYGDPFGPAVLKHAEALRDLRSLQALELFELDDLDVDAFPEGRDLPRLIGCSLFRVLKTDAAALETKLHEIPALHVVDSIAKPKKDSRATSTHPTNSPKKKAAWHPFSAWNDDDEDLGRRAGIAWYRAIKYANELDQTVTSGDAEAVIIRFLKALNRLNGQYSFETTHREDAGEAVLELASRLRDTVTPARAQELFDQLRDF